MAKVTPITEISLRYARSEQRKDYRNGHYTRDFVTRFGTLRRKSKYNLNK